MLAGSHRNAWPDETGTGGRTNRNTQITKNNDFAQKVIMISKVFLRSRTQYCTHQVYAV